MSKKVNFSLMIHPKREKYLSYLKNNIPDLKVNWDEGKGVWDTARRAWLSYDPDKEFQCVIQDDVILCNDFVDKVEKLVEKGDEYVYNLFIRDKGQSELRDKWKQGFKDGYIIWWKLNWALGVVVPTKLVEDMVAFCDKMTDPKHINRDDERMKEYFKSIGKKIYYPIPCLVEHRDEEDSLIGFGSNRGRKAVKFLGE